MGPTLTREALFLGVAEDHPLAQRDQVSIEDVADYHVVPMEDVQPHELVERWIPRTTPNGRTIRRLRVPFAQMARDDPGELRSRISWWIRTGRIVHPAMEPTRAIHGPGISWVPITDMPPLRSALVWLHGESNDRLREFARLARDVLGQERTEVASATAALTRRENPVSAASKIAASSGRSARHPQTSTRP
jgi:hypothetical protein